VPVGRRVCCPRALARLLPSAVRVRIRSRSTSARPPITAKHHRPVLVPVSAHGSANDRNCALASTEAFDDAEQLEGAAGEAVKSASPSPGRRGRDGRACGEARSGRRRTRHLRKSLGKTVCGFGVLGASPTQIVYRVVLLNDDVTHHIGNVLRLDTCRIGAADARVHHINVAALPSRSVPEYRDAMVRTIHEFDRSILTVGIVN
jgi:hypothetical protein